MFQPSQRTFNNLKGVHPDLVKLVLRTLEISSVDFVVTEGVRTLNKEKEAVAAGKSATLHSMHLVQPDGYGHAIDLAAIVDGAVSWEEEHYHRINDTFQTSSQELDIPVTWGGTWSYPHDCDHWQLNRVTT